MQGLRPEQNRSNLPVVRILRKKYNAAAGSIYDKNKKLRIRICRAADYNQAHPGFPDDFSIFSSGCKQTNLSTYSGCKDTHIKRMCKILLPLFSSFSRPAWQSETLTGLYGSSLFYKPVKTLRSVL